MAGAANTHRPLLEPDAIEPIGIDDIDNEDRHTYMRQNVNDSALKRKYAKQMALFKEIARRSTSTDPTIMTADEKGILCTSEPHILAAQDRDDLEDITRLTQEILPLFLSIKKAHLKEKQHGPSTSRLRAPQGKFPRLRLKGGSAEDSLNYYVWKTAALQTADDNTYSNAALLQMARDAIEPERLRDRLTVCQSLDDVFRTIERTIPTRTHAIEKLLTGLENGAYGPVTLRYKPHDVIEKIEKIDHVISGLQCIEPRLDITQKTAHCVLHSFGLMYGGSARSQQEQVDKWLSAKMADKSQYIILALQQWLEDVRGQAYSQKDLEDKMAARAPPEERRDKITPGPAPPGQPGEECRLQAVIQTNQGLPATIVETPHTKSWIALP